MVRHKATVKAEARIQERKINRELEALMSTIPSVQITVDNLRQMYLREMADTIQTALRKVHHLANKLLVPAPELELNFPLNRCFVESHRRTKNQFGGSYGLESQPPGNWRFLPNTVYGRIFFQRGWTNLQRLQ